MSSIKPESTDSQRKLRPDEQALWELATKSVIRVDQTEETNNRSDLRQRQRSSYSGFAKHESKVRNDLFAPDQSAADDLAVHMDRKAYQRMQSGKLSPEGILDLHGLTVEQAHSELTRFIKTSYAARQRLLLVITGKGERRAEDNQSWQRPTGVLRRVVPQWLRTPPLSQVILQQSFAHQRHGGAGALYVYLRRQRKKPVANGK
ncbi:MAG: Smr/MutS family protein [Aestuariivita sp.]|nr:Smr/MutS family protein [Aestuariivita sp.]MCY4202579.1 Smr/MutS family protein [Aestuariivita sp.]